MKKFNWKYRNGEITIFDIVENYCPDDTQLGNLRDYLVDGQGFEEDSTGRKFFLHTCLGDNRNSWCSEEDLLLDMRNTLKLERVRSNPTTQVDLEQIHRVMDSVSSSTDKTVSGERSCVTINGSNSDYKSHRFVTFSEISEKYTPILAGGSVLIIENGKYIIVVSKDELIYNQDWSHAKIPARPVFDMITYCLADIPTTAWVWNAELFYNSPLLHIYTFSQHPDGWVEKGDGKFYPVFDTEKFPCINEKELSAKQVKGG